MAIVKKYLSEDKTIRLAATVSTSLVQASIEHQQVSALSLVLMGRLVTGTALMASQLKEQQKIGVYMRGDGPVGTLFAEASYEGAVRTYCANRLAAMDGLNSVGDGIGTGFLEVVRDLPFQKEPHRGTVNLKSGEVGEDLAYYLRQSQQIPAVVALSTTPQETGCSSAGGYILEFMPGFDPKNIDKVEAIQRQVPALDKLLEQGARAEDLVADFLLNIPFEELEHPHSLRYECSCSMERMERSLMTIGRSEIKELIAANEVMEVVCEFCGKKYEINPVGLQRLLGQM